MLVLSFADKTTWSISEVWEEAVCGFGSKTSEYAGEQGGWALLATAACSTAGQERWVGLWMFNCSAGARNAGFKERLLKGAKPLHEITDSSWPLWSSWHKGLKRAITTPPQPQSWQARESEAWRGKCGVLRPQPGGRAGSKATKCFLLSGLKHSRFQPSKSHSNCFTGAK